MVIHFKFRNEKKWKTVVCETTFMSIKDLLNAVAHKTRLAKYMSLGQDQRVRGKKFEPIQLNVIAVKPFDEGAESSGMIRNGSYVLLSRLPLFRGEPIVHDIHR